MTTNPYLNYCFNTMFTANATRLTPESKGFKMLKHIIETGGSTKYDCLLIAGKTGTRKQLKGYYSCYFQSWRFNGIVELDKTTHKYSITALGETRFNNAKNF